MVNVMTGVPYLRHAAWGEALLVFAALVVVPLLMDLLGDEFDDARTVVSLRVAEKLQFPAALALVLAYLVEPGVLAALCAVPWAGVLLLLAGAGLRRLIRRGWRSLPLLCREFGLIYAAVAAPWLLADRLGLRPLGFDSSIVLLTSVHFHYAGLLMPALTGFALEALRLPRVFNLIGVGVIAGVPAVAVGITSSQLALSRDIEMAAAMLMAASGLGVGALHLWLAMQTRWPMRARCLWVAAGCALAAGMALALLYAVRSFFHPWPWLDIPWMRVLHGSLNALGFGLCGVLAWRRARQRTSSA